MKEKRNLKQNLVYIFFYILLSLSIILSIIYIKNFFLLKKDAEEQSNLLNNLEINESIKEKIPNNIEEDDKEIIEKNKEIKRIEEVKKLQEENQDIIGWLEIENTNINYPVLQGKDNSYYMTHNYKKKKSKNGSIFLNADYDWNIPSNNLLLYGHNLGNGTMFQELLKYQKKSFYKEHPIIRFTTVEEDANYQIISVFKSRVYYKSETNVFRYYYFINSKSKEEYNQFIKNAKKASLYDIDETAQYGDELITLSTCSYHVEDGRFAVIGKKIKK